MQKNLTLKFMIAAVAMTGFAAQAGTVEIYGNVDGGIARMKDLDGTKYTIVGSGFKDHSFIGFKGSEDLGNGLKANFVLESGFNVSNGAQEAADTTFSRNAYVGLSGKLGALKIGQFSSFSRDLLKQYDAFGGELWGSAGGWSQFNTQGGFQSNSVAYTNQVGPVSYGVSHQVSGVADGGLTDGSVTSFAGGYSQGAVALGLVYTHDKRALVNTAKVTQIGGSIDTRIGKAYAMYENGKDTVYANDAKDAYTIGFKAPVSKAAALLVSVGDKEDADGTEHSLYAIGGEYNMSKRTSLYTSFSKDDIKNVGNVSAFAAGLTHKF